MLLDHLDGRTTEHSVTDQKYEVLIQRNVDGGEVGEVEFIRVTVEGAPSLEVARRDVLNKYPGSHLVFEVSDEKFMEMARARGLPVDLPMRDIHGKIIDLDDNW
jgi:hypothetical protein